MSFPNPRITPGSVGPGGSVVGDVLLFDDFILSNVDATTEIDSGWFATSVSGTFTIKDGERGGVLRIDGNGGTNQGAYIQANGSGFTLAAGKDIFFECRIKVIEPLAVDFFLGLGSIDVAPLLTIQNCIGFGSYDTSADLLDGGTGDIWSISKASSTATAHVNDSTLADTGVNLATTYHTLAFHVLGNKRIKFYVDGAEKSSIITNLPTGAMTVHMAMLENAGSDPELLVDYIYCAQVR